MVHQFHGQPLLIWVISPTAALAEIEFPAGSWHEVGKTPGELTRFVVPRELG